MNRQAACDPCRRAKLSCDHQKPVCGRCAQSRKSVRCVYRTAPFQRRRSNIQPTDSLTEQSSREVNYNVTEAAVLNSSPQRGPYPRLGHFGSLSHVAIFNQIPVSDTQAQPLPSNISPEPITQPSPAASLHLDGITKQVSELLKQLLDTFDIVSMKTLVEFWCAKGVSLALAECILPRCVDSIEYLRSTLISHDMNWHSTLTARLIQSSMKPLDSTEATTLYDFTEQFCGRHTRWETLGIFFAAVVRATFDISFFPNLYATEARKHELHSLAARLNKCILELCLSLDCLNDLQLIFQYENFIVQSYVDGDHNLSSYRSLGDAITFLFALGYHEDIRCKSNVPPFLVELRKTAFARIYSADKNVALFLGRPPRMSKRFCYFQVPTAQPSAETVMHKPMKQALYVWPDDAAINYAAESCWTALCASVKEEILEFFLRADRISQGQKAADMYDRIELQWLALPTHFRLTGDLNDRLKNVSRPTPFELDFLANTRLNYLHTHFVLRLGLLSGLADPDDTIIKLARQMLSLTLETMLLRDHLVNSGISLIWKIAHYGLPAAGILLLSMLSRRSPSELSWPTLSRVWQDLSILSAEVRLGSIIRPGQPLYGLFSKAAETIQTILESENINRESVPLNNTAEHEDRPAIDAWLGQWSPDSWNMEAEFWQNLAEHPYINGANPTT